MKARILCLVLVPGILQAVEIKTTDGATIHGDVVRIIPAAIEIKTPHGTVPVPLASLTPESQTQVLGKECDAEKISKMKAMLDRAAEIMQKPDSAEISRLKYINELQEKLIKNLKSQLAEKSGPDSDSDSDSGGVPDEVVSILKSKAEKMHPSDPTTQLYVVKGNIEAYLKLREIPNSPIKQRAAKDHPYDFCTQLYVVESASKAQNELTGIR